MVWGRTAAHVVGLGGWGWGDAVPVNAARLEQYSLFYRVVRPIFSAKKADKQA
jgi:hypothetical protein